MSTCWKAENLFSFWLSPGKENKSKLNSLIFAALYTIRWKKRSLKNDTCTLYFIRYIKGSRHTWFKTCTLLCFKQQVIIENKTAEFLKEAQKWNASPKPPSWALESELYRSVCSMASNFHLHLKDALTHSSVKESDDSAQIRTISFIFFFLNWWTGCISKLFFSHKLSTKKPEKSESVFWKNASKQKSLPFIMMISYLFIYLLNCIKTK